MATGLSYAFDPSKGETPESLKRKRRMAEALMASAASTPRNVGEGLNSIGQALLYRSLAAKADAGEKAGLASGQKSMGGIIDALGLGKFPARPSANGNVPPPDGSVPLPEADVASARVSQAHGDNDIRGGIIQTASALGIDPADLATAISYETAGTFDPTKRGPTTQWGQHRGLIQFGEPQAKKYGVDWNDPVGSQLGPDGAVAKYLRDTGVEPGMGLMDIYSAINAGGVGRYNRSDANNGGAPGTVADKVNNQMSGHRKKAMALLGMNPSAPAQAPAPASGLTPDALQEWATSNYQPSQANDAVAAVNALGTERPVPVAGPDAGMAAAMAGQGQQPLQPRPGMMPRLQQAMPPQQADAGATMLPTITVPPGQQAPVAQPRLPAQAGPVMPQPQAAPNQPSANAPRLEMSGNVDIPQPTGPTMQQLAQALGNPFLPDGFRPIAQGMLDQQMQAQDPMRQMQLEKGRLELERLRNPQPEMTAEQQNLSWRAQQAGLQPGTPEYTKFMLEGGGKGTNITVNTGEGDKFYENLDKKNAETFSALSEAGVMGRAKMGQIDRLGELMDRAPQGASAMLKQAAGEYGINTEGLSDIQAAQALINELVPQQRQPGSGPMSDADLALFKQSLPRLINQREGNQLILDTMRNITRYQIQMGDIADLVADREISPAEGRKMIRELANPLEGFGEQSGLRTGPNASPEGNGITPAPEGVDPADWEFMSPEDRKLFQ